MQWLLRHDSTEQLQYAPLQGETAKEILHQVELPPGLDSLLYVQETEKSISVEWYSTGVLQLLRLLPFPWSMGRLLLWVPRIVRDGIYRLIAKHRLRWFGVADACRLPTQEEESRFLP